MELTNIKLYNPEFNIYIKVNHCFITCTDIESFKSAFINIHDVVMLYKSMLAMKHMLDDKILISLSLDHKIKSKPIIPGLNIDYYNDFDKCYKLILHYPVDISFSNIYPSNNLIIDFNYNSSDIPNIKVQEYDMNDQKIVIQY